MPISKSRKKKSTSQNVSNTATQNSLLKLKLLCEKNKFEEAAKLSDLLLRQGWSGSEFVQQRTIALIGCGNKESALSFLQRVAPVPDKDLRLLTAWGRVHVAMGKLDDALNTFHQIARQLPSAEDAWNLFGILLHERRAFEQAIESFDKALASAPDRLDIIQAKAQTLVDANRHADSLLELEKLRQRHEPSQWIKEGEPLWLTCLKQLGKTDELEAWLEDQTKIDSTASYTILKVWDVRVFLYEQKAMLAEAISLTKQFIETLPENAIPLGPLNRLATLTAAMGNQTEAVQILKQCLDLTPENATVRFNLALSQLAAGHIPEAYENYEYRWDSLNFPSVRRRFSATQWQGENLNGKEILVWEEQGIGDQIRWLSLVGDLLNQGAKVTIETSTKLSRLVERSYPDAIVRQGNRVNCEDDSEYAQFDFHTPLASLAKHFRPTLADFYSNQKPWLARNNELEQKVRGALQKNETDTLIIGICWRSGMQNTTRNQHYLSVEDFAPLKLLNGVKLVNLQYSVTREELEEAREIGLALHDFTDLNQKDDLYHTCGLIGACDLVLSVGTAVAELSCSLGTPTVILQGPKGQINLGTDHIPWHPTGLSYFWTNETKELAVADVVSNFEKLNNWIKSLQ